MFRAARLGTLGGKRTLGAGVEKAGKNLLDGGIINVPDWGHYDHTKGVWTAENLGVPPDIEVDILPADWRAGGIHSLNAQSKSHWKNCRRPRQVTNVQSSPSIDKLVSLYRRVKRKIRNNSTNILRRRRRRKLTVRALLPFTLDDEPRPVIRR